MVNQLSPKTKTNFNNSNNWLLINQYLKQLQEETFVNEQKQKQINSDNIFSNQKRLELALKILKYGDFQQRWEVEKLFPKLGEVAIDYLIEILENEDNELEYRWFAGKILRKFDHHKIVISLVNLLQTTKEEELYEMTSDTLANLGGSAIQGLSNLLIHSKHRLLATKTLAQIRHKDAILALFTVVNDKDPRVRALAIEALGSFQDEKIFPILIEALNDNASIVRKEAVSALGFYKNTIQNAQLISHLEPLLGDINLEIAQQTAISISRFNNEDAAKVLFKTLSSSLTPIPLQMTIIKCLGWIEIEESLSYLEKAFNLVKEDGILEIIQILGRFKKPNLILQATTILINFYQSQHSSLNQSIIKAKLAYSLGNLGLKQARQTLQELEKDHDSSVSIHGISALKKIN